MEFERILTELKCGYSFRILHAEFELKDYFYKKEDFNEFINHVKDLIDTFGLNAILNQTISINYDYEIKITDFFFNPNKSITIFIK